MEDELDSKIFDEILMAKRREKKWEEGQVENIINRRKARVLGSWGGAFGDDEGTHIKSLRLFGE